MYPGVIADVKSSNLRPLQSAVVMTGSVREENARPCLAWIATKTPKTLNLAVVRSEWPTSCTIRQGLTFFAVQYLANLLNMKGPPIDGANKQNAVGSKTS